MALSSHRRLLVPHINKKSPGTRPGLLATQEIACDDLAALGLLVHGTLLVDRRSSVAVSAGGIDPGHAA